MRARLRCFGPSAGSAARTVGTRRTRSGRCAASSTAWWADPDCVAVVAALPRSSFGDALDFWRVTGIEPGRRLILRAEMKVPGVATLEFELEPTNGATHLSQIARFQPRGLLGIVYWFSVMPLHSYVFRSMLRGIRETAEAELTAIGGATENTKATAPRP